MAKIEVPLRAVIDDPPAGVRWALQRGKGSAWEPVAPAAGAAQPLAWDFTVTAELTPDGVRLLGPFVQGPPEGRFFYLGSGQFSGDGSRSGRRAKVSLAGITRALIESLGPGEALEARIAGTGKDGCAACATVPLKAPGWRVVDR